ncbi:MAG: hypothetical protein ABI920_12810 [Casimicrobiaceae bacterium]
MSNARPRPWWVPLSLALLCGASAYAARAAATEPDECAQAAQFIGNAAKARDLGMSREEFIAHMEADFQVIRAFPPQLRWFAENEQDEEFLLNAARDVFDHPAAPESHARRFVRACLTRTDV